MIIAVPNELRDDETRVALVPAVVKKLVAGECEVKIEAGAGVGAHFGDEEYEKAGARVVPGDQADELWSQADIVITLGPPNLERAGRLKQGAVVVGLLGPLKHTQLVKALAERGVTAFSAEFIPRISRAQAMDVLSSQANLGGYKAVLLAAEVCPKIFPMLMTAAGTLAPAKVFVIGVGVAGLQAIATAKRLGAVVEAFDVRAATKEQVHSLGARFVELPTAKQDDSATGGYAKEQTADEQKQQAELMARHVTGADVVITTAAVFGKAPPMLIPKDVVAGMRAGTVMVDMAADPDAGRGNCELTNPGERITTENGVVIDGRLNLPRMVPVHASQMYANNMLAFVKELLVAGGIKIDTEDEIQKGALITHEGNIVNELVKRAVEASG